MVEVTRAAAVPRAPRAIAWVLLLAAAAAVLVTGLVATALVFARGALAPVPSTPRFWTGLLLACGTTVASLGLRALRFIFLLRRAETRIPIRDAYIGYFAGFALLLAPLFLGEIALRAWILRRRGGVRVAVTAVVNLWERWLDALAIALIAGTLWWWAGETSPAVVALGAVAIFVLVAPVRRAWLALIVRAVGRVMPGTGANARVLALPLPRLAQTATVITALLTSVAAWLLPALGCWLLVSGSGASITPWRAMLTYTSATLIAGVTFSPGGVVVAGGRLLDGLRAAGIESGGAALIVLAIRLATAGVSTALGLAFLLLHTRSAAVTGSEHFDAIADAYDVQIAEGRRRALVTRKADLMRRSLAAVGAGHRGLDVGCGQGWYVAQMRTLGFDVTGFDASAGQVALAAQHLGRADLVRVGSALSIPADDASVDFVYTINVLHHLPSIDDQRRAFSEMLRVLRPGGVVFLHEINTTNMLFRFYMGYVFPSLNCIDEGVERWLLPRELTRYTTAPIEAVQYFTFFPDFMPERMVRLLAPIERWLERSFLRPYSAHYMAIVRKPA